MSHPAHMHLWKKNQVLILNGHHDYHNISSALSDKCAVAATGWHKTENQNSIWIDKLDWSLVMVTILTEKLVSCEPNSWSVLNGQDNWKKKTEN